MVRANPNPPDLDMTELLQLLKDLLSIIRAYQDRQHLNLMLLEERQQG
jgi:hypothetical protein